MGNVDKRGDGILGFWREAKFGFFPKGEILGGELLADERAIVGGKQPIVGAAILSIASILGSGH